MPFHVASLQTRLLRLTPIVRFVAHHHHHRLCALGLFLAEEGAEAEGEIDNELTIALCTRWFTKILLNDTLHADLAKQHRHQKCFAAQVLYITGEADADESLRVRNFKCVAPAKKVPAHSRITAAMD